MSYAVYAFNKMTGYRAGQAAQQLRAIFVVVLFWFLRKDFFCVALVVLKLPL